jgi:ubiquitin thioesterase protein OTUB1
VKQVSNAVRICISSVSEDATNVDHVQISALSRALRINVKVAYLDGRGDDEKVDFVELNNVEEGYNGMNEVVLLYRYAVGALRRR